MRAERIGSASLLPEGAREYDTHDVTNPKDAAKREALLLTLCGLFVGFFVTAEIVGAKLWDFTLFGLSPASLGLGDAPKFVATAGIFAFPLTFVLTDIVNEYFGKRIVRLFTWIAIGVNVLLQPVILAAANAPTVSFTEGLDAATAHRAYGIAFGATWAIVAASLVAFAIGQLIDASVFTWLRKRTGGRSLWLRSQGSTLVSQLVDSFVVIVLAFAVILRTMDFETACVVAFTNYVYKFAIAVAITPLLYVVHWCVEGWLGRDLAHALAHEAHPRDPE